MLLVNDLEQFTLILPNVSEARSKVLMDENVFVDLSQVLWLKYTLYTKVEESAGPLDEQLGDWFRR